MPVLYALLLSGFIGGVARGLVGYIKYRNSYKNVSFQKGYFIFTVAVSGTVGLLASWVTNDLGISFLGITSLTPAIAMVIGYAGGDFIENLFKILTGKTSLYRLPNVTK